MVFATLKANGAALKVGEVYAIALTVAAENRKPMIHGWINGEIVLADDMEAANLEHGVGADIMKAQVQPLHQGSEEERA